jgi:hypothetical protein
VRENINQMKEQNIGAIYCSERPYLIEFQETLYFQYTPHWHLGGFWGKKLTSLPEEEKSKFIINKRDLNPAKHYQEHDTKYYFYGRSNQIQAFYGKYGAEIVNYHEDLRLKLKSYLQEKTTLGASDLKSFHDFLVFRHNDDKSFIQYEIEMIELEFCLSEYYRRVILGEDFMKDIVPKRERWSFKDFLKHGDGFHNPDYLGTRLKYEQNCC